MCLYDPLCALYVRVCANGLDGIIVHENIEFSKFKAGVCNTAPLTQQTTPLTT